jgi:hypothetical protein
VHARARLLMGDQPRAGHKRRKDLIIYERQAEAAHALAKRVLPQRRIVGHRHDVFAGRLDRAQCLGHAVYRVIVVQQRAIDVEQICAEAGQGSRHAVNANVQPGTPLMER